MKNNIAWWDKTYSWNAENKNHLVYPDEDLVRIVKKFFIPNKIKNVLDLGCGSGRHSLMMVSEGLQVTGIDSSQNALDIAEKLTSFASEKRRFDLVDVTQGLPYDDESFDAVVGWGVLHYISTQDSKKTLQEIHRVLRPGGYFALTLRSVEDSECTNKDNNVFQKSNAYESTELLFRYYNEADIQQELPAFEEIKYGHKTRTLLEDSNRRIAHWFIVCKKI